MHDKQAGDSVLSPSRFSRDKAGLGCGVQYLKMYEASVCPKQQQPSGTDPVSFGDPNT